MRGIGCDNAGLWRHLASNASLEKIRRMSDEAKPQPTEDTLEDWKQAAEVESGLRRNALAENRRLRGLLTQWANLDGDRDDVAALISETREAIA